MKSLDEYKQSVIWHVVTGKYEVMDNGKLRKRETSEMKLTKTLGLVPAHWEETKLGALCTYKGGSIPREELNTEKNGLQYLRTNDINPQSNITKDKLFCGNPPPKAITKRKEDYVIGVSGFNRTPYQGSLGTCYTEKIEAILGDDVWLIIPKSTLEPSLQQWAKEWHRSPSVAEHLTKNATGSIALHGRNKILTERVCYPVEIKERRKILTFLTRFTESLPDPAKAIAAREAVKKSLIWHIVTGKYEVMDNGKLRKRETSEMKNSTVGWIGEIPTKWTTIPIKSCGETKKGQMPPQKFEGDYPYYNGGIKPTGSCESYNYEGETLLMSSGGANAGTITETSGKIWVGADCYVITTKTPFITETLKIVQNIKESYTEGSGMPHTNITKFKAIRIPIASPHEQSKILAFLTSFTESQPDPGKPNPTE